MNPKILSIMQELRELAILGYLDCKYSAAGAKILPRKRGYVGDGPYILVMTDAMEN